MMRYYKGITYLLQFDVQLVCKARIHIFHTYINEPHNADVTTLNNEIFTKKY